MGLGILELFLDCIFTIIFKFYLDSQEQLLAYIFLLLTMNKILNKMNVQFNIGIHWRKLADLQTDAFVWHCHLTSSKPSFYILVGETWYLFGPTRSVNVEYITTAGKTIVC